MNENPGLCCFPLLCHVKKPCSKELCYVVRTEAKEGLCSGGMPMPKKVPRKRVIFPTVNPSNR